MSGFKVGDIVVLVIPRVPYWHNKAGKINYISSKSYELIMPNGTVIDARKNEIRKLTKLELALK
jgi:hypothetical protein